MEDAGHWIPLDQKSDFEIYYANANWIANMWDIVDSSLVKEIGVFNPLKNTKGAVRDHILSRKNGFELKVFVEILRHPTNCQIISASDNSKRKFKKYIDPNNMTLDELFEAILTYNEVWQEQELCVQLIKEYMEGKRWKNE